MLVNIQFLRFIAASLVVLYHTAGRVPAGDSVFSGLFAFGQATGFAGVDVFFVISGFIMAHTSTDNTGGSDGSHFMRRRLARIYSGYWPFFFLALAVFAWARSDHVLESNLLKSFFLWPQPLNTNLLEVTWTLSFELYFYAIFALIIWWLPQARRALVCWAVLLAVMLFNGYRHFVLDSFGQDNLYSLGFFDQFLSSAFVAEFLAGAVTAYYLQRRPHGAGWAWLIAGVFLFAAAGWVNEVQYGGLIEQGFHVVPRVALFGLASVMMVVGLVRIEQRGWQAPLRFSLLSGGASYAIYLAHVPLLVASDQLGMVAWAGGRSTAMASLAYVSLMGVILALSMAWYRYAERPLHHLFRRLLAVAKASNV